MYSNQNANNYGNSGCNGCDGGIGFLIAIILFVVLAIGFFFARFVGKRAENEGHSFVLWAILGFIFNVGALIILETGLIAERKLHDFTTYCIIAAVFGILALLIACFLPKAVFERVVTVNSSQPMVNKESMLVKSHTLANNVVMTKWTCEKCGQINVIDAKRCINCYADKPQNK